MIKCYYCNKEQEQDIFDDGVIVVFCSIDCMWKFIGEKV